MHFLISALIAISSVVSTKAQAASADPTQYKGTWVGRGVYTLYGVQTFCSRVELTFDGDKDHFIFVGGSRVCEGRNEVFSRVEMDVKGNDLLYGEAKVGALNDNVLTSGFSMPEPGSPGQTRNWRNSIRREGSTMIYDESRHMTGEPENKITFAGVLLKQ